MIKVGLKKHKTINGAIIYILVIKTLYYTNQINSKAYKEITIWAEEVEIKTENILEVFILILLKQSRIQIIAHL